MKKIGKNVGIVLFVLWCLAVVSFFCDMYVFEFSLPSLVSDSIYFLATCAGTLGVYLMMHKKDFYEDHEIKDKTIIHLMHVSTTTETIGFDSTYTVIFRFHNSRHYFPGEFKIKRFESKEDIKEGSSYIKLGSKFKKF